MSAFKDTLGGLNKLTKKVAEPKLQFKPKEIIEEPKKEEIQLKTETVIEEHIENQIDKNLEPATLLEFTPTVIEKRPRESKRTKKSYRTKTFNLETKVSRVLELLAMLEERTQSNILEELVVKYCNESEHTTKLKMILD